jgi:hypothetical protein
VELWRGSDPDDTDPFWLEFWRKAKHWNGNTALTDAVLPRGRLHVFRGQPRGAPTGISWSLSFAVAQKFAVNGGGRVPRHDGIVKEGYVFAHQIYAYIDERGEQEVVTDAVEEGMQ